MNNYYIISFPSSHHAIIGEKVAEEAYDKEVCGNGTNTNESGSKELRLIPTPPEVSAGCGLVLRLPQDALNCAFAIFKERKIGYEQVFFVEEKDGKKVYTQVENS